MGVVPVIAIKRKLTDGSEIRTIINVSDYNKESHVLWQEKQPEKAAIKPTTARRRRVAVK